MAQDSGFTQPAQVAPAQVAPAQMAPAQMASAQVAPAQMAPAQMASAQVAPAQAAPAQVASVQVAPAQVAPAQVDSAQPSSSGAQGARTFPQKRTAESAGLDDQPPSCDICGKKGHRARDCPQRYKRGGGGGGGKGGRGGRGRGGGGPGFFTGGTSNLDRMKAMLYDMESGGGRGGHNWGIHTTPPIMGMPLLNGRCGTIRVVL